MCVYVLYVHDYMSIEKNMQLITLGFYYCKREGKN